MILTVSNRANSYFQFMVVLFLFVAVLAVTLVTTKWIAGYQKDKMLCSNMEVIETMRISNSKYIQIARVGKEYIAYAVCKDTVTFLTKVPEEQLISGQQKDAQTIDFKDLFDKAKKINILGKTDKEEE